MIAERALGILAGILACSIAKLGCIALGIWLNAAAPNFVARALATYQRRGKWSFVLGVVNVAALTLLFVILANAHFHLLRVLGLLTLFLLLSASFIGYTLAYQDLGQRLRGEANWPAYCTILAGGVVAELAFFVPLLGQVFSLAVLFRGLGAVISTLLRRSE